MFVRYFLTAALFFSLLGGSALAAAPANDTDKEQLRAALADLLRENPDLVFDVLRTHNDLLYDIAMQGREVRILKDYQVQWTQDLATPKDPQLDGHPVRGPEDAPVTIVAYSDFTCSYCQRAAITIEQLVGIYGARIRFVFKAVPHDPEGVITSRRAADYFYAAYAIDPQKAWVFYAHLFSQQNSLHRDGESFLRKAWVECGFDAAVIAKATTAKSIGDLLAQNAAEGTKFKLQGTPCFLINGMVIAGAQPPEIFEAAIERALREAGVK